ncbi:MAG: rRNA small subunit methyltransferase 1, partial [Acholeplasmataceae bacterium]|nr:rRNA small subunit methyltransferase 1 [Acholeplasmataceae bacterium]
MQKSFKEVKPTLYVVSTPIGNLKDITYRAVEILREVDFILAEDTRTSSVLLSHYDIKKPLLSYHEFNKEEQETKIIDLLNEGKSLALISDAGTPGISDPGYEIIKRVIEEGFYAVSIPGASAILSALVVSGLIIQPFTYIGFLPRKANDQKNV